MLSFPDLRQPDERGLARHAREMSFARARYRFSLLRKLKFTAASLRRSIVSAWPVSEQASKLAASFSAVPPGHFKVEPGTPDVLVRPPAPAEMELTLLDKFRAACHGSKSNINLRSSF